MAWEPNILQVLTSEIQNILELEALATDEEELRDPATHTGLSYYLLDAIEQDSGPDAPEHLATPLQALIDKIVETLRHKLVADPKLRELGTALLVEELRALEWPAPREPRSKLYNAAVTMTRARGANKPKKEESMFALNSFLSTERFRRRHLTTGTIFRSVDRREYWVCASPSCDMVARTPSAFQTWARDLHPFRAMVAVRLHEAKMDKALKEAHNGRHAFLHEDEKLAFCVVDNPSSQPVYEFFFAENSGIWNDDDAGNKMFKASRIKPDAKNTETRALISEDFIIVGQLRPSYAVRILHTVGQHLSRVGLDFISLPE